MTSSEALQQTVELLTRRLAGLAAVNAMLRSTRALMPVYRIAAEQLRLITPLDSCLIGVYDAQSNVLRYEYGWDEGVPEERFDPRDLAEAPLSERVIRGAALVTVDDLLDDPALRSLMTFGQEAKLSRSWMGAPLISGGAVHGLIAIMSYTPAIFGPPAAEALLSFAAELALAVEYAKREDRLRETIAQLSTPIIPVAEGVLVLPLIGGLDVLRAELIAERTLDAVVARQAEVVLFDLTGIGVVDMQVLDALLRVIRAVELLGARAALVGIKPLMAHEIAALGVDLLEYQVYRDLQTALANTVKSPDD